jgi:hypothetical protein
MDRQFKTWELAIDLLWSSDEPDYREAAWLVADIARSSWNEPLRRAAVLAVPSLRAAMLRAAQPDTKELAIERLGVVRNILRVLTGPHFGKRHESEPRTDEQRHREALGLPLAGRLSQPQIHQAWKRAAKTAHPDMGGDVQAFVMLSTARDALMKEG